MTTRKPYPSDVSDQEWAFVAPYLALLREDAPQRNHDLREVFNGLRWIVRTGSAWRYMPHDLPPWEAVYQQMRRWLEAGVFKEMVHDLRLLLRLLEGRASEPTPAILDSPTLHSTPESGSRGGYDGAKRKKGSKVHAAVDTLVQTLSEGLREAAHHSGGVALCCLRLPLPQSGNRLPRRRSITRSRACYELRVGSLGSVAEGR
jgi:transposase